LVVVTIYYLKVLKMNKIIINGKEVRRGRVLDDDLIETLDAPYSAEYLKNEDGEYELLSVNSQYSPSADEVVEELEELGFEDPIEVVIIGADTPEDLVAAVEEAGYGDTDLLEEALGEAGNEDPKEKDIDDEDEVESEGDDDDLEDEIPNDEEPITDAAKKKTQLPKRTPKRTGSQGFKKR
jgi:hypothetical protein